MAALTQTKMVNKPLRMMGAKSTDVEGQVLYFEYGTFSIADNVTSGTIATSLTNIVWAGFHPTNAAALLGNAYSTLVLTTGTIPIANVDPNGTAIYAYLLIGTIETA